MLTNFNKASSLSTFINYSTLSNVHHDPKRTCFYPSRPGCGPEIESLRKLPNIALPNANEFGSMFKLHAEAAGNGLDCTTGGELSPTRRGPRAWEALIALDLPDLRSSKFQWVSFAPCFQYT
jgi:hypothetical protein